MGAIPSERRGKGANLGVNVGERCVKRVQGISELSCRGRDRGKVVGGGDERFMGARGKLLEVKID